MVSKLKEEWIKDPQLKHWNGKSCVQDNKCGCSEPQLVELWEQDSCVRGRMYTVLQDSIAKLRVIPNENKIHYQLLQL